MNPSTYIYVLQSAVDGVIGNAYRTYDGALDGLRQYLVDYEMTEDEVDELDADGKLDTIEGVGARKIMIMEVPYFGA